MGELVIIERGGSPRPIENYITNAEDGLNWVKIGDAPSQGRYITHTTEKIKPTGLSKTRQVEPGDLILSNSMSFGKPYIMAISGCIHDGWLLIRNNQNIFDLKFLCHMLGINQMTAQYKAMAAGSTVNNLNKSLVSNSVITIPSKTEQRKIGALLESLDDVIALHQRKSKVLQNEELHSLNIVWEQRKLGELAQFNPPSDLPEEFEYVDLESVIGTEMVSHRKELKKSAPSRAQRLARKGDVFYQTVRPYQKNNYIFKKDDKNYVFSTGYAQLRPYINGDFLFTLVQTENFVSTVLDNCTGTSYPAINSNILADIKVSYIESEDEQMRIGMLFKSLNNLITLHQSKLEKLQKIKKSMLERMFV